jgi:guanylate kinase
MIEKRIAKAAIEMEDMKHFDRVVINDDLAHAFEQLDAIVTSNI